MVTISGPEGKTCIAESGSFVGAPDALAPLQWYPDSRADSLAVTLSSDKGIFGAVFRLSKAPLGENAAYALQPGMHPLELTEGPASMVSPDAAEPLFSHRTRALISSTRGNPIVAAAEIADVGGEVHIIEAQRIGGGAYTRQFIYCFTPDGIMALTHDVAGRHTNCRRISEACVSDPDRVAGFDGGVAALSDAGALMIIADARVEKRIRGLPKPKGLAWRESCDELLVSLEEADFALRGLGAEELAERTEPGTHWLHRGPVPVRIDSATRAIFIAEPGAQERMPAAWTSEWIESELKGYAVCEVRMSDPRNASVLVEMDTPKGVVKTLKFRVKGKDVVTSRRAMIMPAACGFRPRFRVSIQGEFREIIAVRIMEAEFPWV